VTQFDVIVPAGGRLSPEFASIVGVDNKALIEFQGETILERTIRALKETGRTDRIIVIGPKEVADSPGGQLADAILEPQDSAPKNILNGLKYLLQQPNPPSKVVVITSDLPFLTPDILTRFIDSCPNDRDICVPLVTKSSYVERFPGATATFIPLKDDTWTAGCAYLMDAVALQKSIPQFERVFANRKSKLGMAKLLGFKFLFKVITKTLTVPEVEAKIVDMLGCSGKAIFNSPPELSYDIDDEEDYNFALKHIAEANHAYRTEK
jgi:molybdopterin-guanine dinucleotide biosynthesis protein A